MEKVDKKFLFYAVTTTSTSLESIEKACQGHISILQLREKNLSLNEFVAKAKLVSQITRKYKIPLIINDQLDVFKMIEADGLHLGQEDLGAKVARKAIGTNKILGISVSNIKEAIKAEQEGADYLGVGAIFPTTTKPDAKIVSLNTLREIIKHVKIPIIAIGGLDYNNIILLSKIKIRGLAFSSAIFKGDPLKNSKKLYKEIKKQY